MQGLKFTLIAAAVLGCTGWARAALKAASLFTDHAVLQRGLPVPVWGEADPGAAVTVEFAGQEKTAEADESGRWTVTLEPLAAAFEPGTMRISSSIGNEQLQFNDLVVGEVWICSGQSNMQMGYGSIPELTALVPQAQRIRCFNVPRTVAFDEQAYCGGAWTAAVPESAAAFAFAYFLEKAADVPVGIVQTSWGSSSIEAWMPRDMAETVPHFKTMMDEFDADTAAREKIQAILDGPKPWSSKEDVFLRRQSNILYNAMLHPLAPYACRGLVWYQGERNTQSMFGMVEEPWFSRNSGILKYGPTLRAWIRRCRQLWGRDDFEFLIVMLPGYHGKPLPTGPQLGAEHPAVHSWAWMREAQLSALALPHVAVANTVDLGDVKNIHPKDKLPVGQRLALLAQRDTLGMQVEALGPVLKTAKADGGKLVVSFEHAAGLKTTDGAAPLAFWVADDAGEWAPADAVIEGETVVLISGGIKAPKYVRYAFAGKPSVNLVNGAGLPAYPFRTDSFEP